jgi:hypothetical protein
MIYKSIQGKMIGKIADGIFYKQVKKSKHLLRKWDAWGIDQAILDNLVKEGIQEIAIFELEEHTVYSVSVKDFIEKGILADFGYSKQVFLPIVNFKKERLAE